MATGAATIFERKNETASRPATWTRLLGRRRVARTGDGDNAAFVRPVTDFLVADADAFAPPIVTEFVETEETGFTAAEGEGEAESAAFLLRQSHALVAELRIVVAARAAISTTNR